LRSIKEIKENEELTLSYIEIASSYKNRNSTLSFQYFFTCTCEKCEKKEKDEFLIGKICFDCKSLLEEDVCKKCNKALNLNKFEKDIKMANELFKMGEFKKCFEIQKKFLHPLNEDVMKTLNALIKYSIDNQHFNEAIQYCHEILPIYECK
jgi:hypothetical protein